MDWPDHAIWWHVYPLGFCGAPRELTPATPIVDRLDRIEGWLDYAVELGCSGLAFGPVFASATHGYDTVDHLRIDPRLGTDDDFDRLIAGAGRRGLRVLLDGVFNHVGRDFPALHDGRAARWFRRRSDGEYDTFEGHPGLVALNHDEPEVAEYVATVMTHWLDRGAAGWRLDAAYAVPAEFWRRVLPPVRAEHPDAWFVGEVIHGDYAGYVTDSGLDSVTQYELWKAIWSSLNDGNLFELEWALRRHGEFARTFAPLTFVGNHDVTRLASRLDNPAHVGHAIAVLFTIAGVPSVYYGDEQAFRGVKEDRAGGDDAVRPEYPDSPADLAPDGWPVYRAHQRLIGLRRRNPWLVRAQTTTEHLANRAMALRVRPDGSDEPGLLLLLNIGDRPYRFPVEAAGLSVVESAEPGTRPADPLLVPAQSWAVLGR